MTPQIMGPFPSRQAMLDTIGFVDMSHKTAKDPDGLYFEGPICLLSGQQFIEVYIGQGEAIWISLGDPMDIRFPRKPLGFQYPEVCKVDPNQAPHAAIKYSLDFVHWKHHKY